MNKVSHVQFVEYLAEKLGIPEEEVVKKLTELILRIKAKSTSGEIAINGLGTFSTKNKTLVFLPEESFEIEINHTYAGMMPVEIDKPKSKTAQAASKQDKEKTKNGDDDSDGKDDRDGDKDKAQTADITENNNKEVTSPDFEEEEFVDVINNIDPFDFDDDTLGIEDEEKKDTRESTNKTGKTPEKDDIDPFDVDSDDPEAEAEEAERVRNVALKAEEKRMLEAAEAEEELEKQKQARAAAEAEAEVKKLEAVKAVKKSEAEAQAKADAEAKAKAEVVEKLEKEKAESEAKAVADKQKAAAVAAQARAEEREQADAELKKRKKVEEELQGESGKDEITPSLVDSDGETQEKATAAPLATDSKTDSKDIHINDRTRPASNSGMIAMALIAAVILIAAALYFFGFMPGTQPQPGPASTQQTVIPPIAEQPADQTDAIITEERQLAEEEAEQDVTAQPTTQPADSPADVVQEATSAPAETNAAQGITHGLRGTINTSLPRPYTIIVHSLNSRSDAVREQEQIALAGFRSTFYAVELPDGRTNWRVTIGQFADVESAVQASQQLPEPYLTNNFIGRIEAYNP